jgi:hypothetical protein
LTTKLQETLDQRLLDLENLYKQELEEGGSDKKKLKEIHNLYEENKETLSKEFNRLKSIVSDLDF